jgi:hypothetical protein
MKTIVCKCGARRVVAGPAADRPLLSAIFAFVDVVALVLDGWSCDDGRPWRCRHCTRRANLLHVVKSDPACNVTSPPPPTGAKW